ncbi:MAG: P1 family peptidase [Granulosicoccaceae bacterium]
MGAVSNGAESAFMVPGARNLITDVPGVRVGHAHDKIIKTGCTVVVAEQPFVAAVDVMGGAPGTRETDCLDPGRLVTNIDALVLSGGSAFGLDAASGVADALRAAGKGFSIGPVTVPIVPAAIIFDLLNGGDKTWTNNPYRDLGVEALTETRRDFELGSVGAGYGASCANLKGGLGSASLVLPSGYTVGALVVANPHGSAVVPDGKEFWAAPYEVDKEYGGFGCGDSQPLRMPSNEKMAAYEAMANTTLVIVATDAVLNKSQSQRLAVASQDGIARAITPAHTQYDGDLVFAMSTGTREIVDAQRDFVALGHAAAICVSRSIARAVFMAQAMPGDILPSWAQQFSGAE